MIFSHPHKKILIPFYAFNDITFLGVIIDENMSWRNHTEYISKVSKTIDILLRARQMLYGHTLQLLYHACFNQTPFYIMCGVDLTHIRNTFKNCIYCKSA